MTWFFGWVQALANAATIVGALFVVLQLRTAAQAARIQAWAFLLDTSNRRWTHYTSSADDLERKFALGELLNFMEVLAGDVDRNRLPSAIRDQVAPYLIGVIELMARDDTVRVEVRSLRVNSDTFAELRQFCEKRITKFGQYTKVAQLFADLGKE